MGTMNSIFNFVLSVILTIVISTTLLVFGEYHANPFEIFIIYWLVNISMRLFDVRKAQLGERKEDG